MSSNPAVLYWIGGWASNCRCWSRDISEMYPEFEHLFADTLDILEGRISLDSIFEKAKSGDRILAWSMGSLLLHDWLAGHSGSLNLRGIRMLSISPIFDFCGQPGGWPPAVVKLMIKKLSRQKKEVLEDFFNKMASRSNPSQSQKAAWRKQALSDYDLQGLRRGLMYLMETKVLPEQVKKAESHITFLIDRHDPISHEPAGLSSLASSVTYHSHGHIPFIRESEILKKLMC
jgi:hypothetical protein